MPIAAEEEYAGWFFRKWSADKGDNPWRCGRVGELRLAPGGRWCRFQRLNACLPGSLCLTLRR